jgi:hypothetical protein
LRERSPLYIPPICGIVTCDSSAIRIASARQVIEQGRRRIARLAAGQMTRVVLDALAITQLQHHLDIELGALLDPLRLEQLAGAFQLGQALGAVRP